MLKPIVLLLISNVFMTFAWYGHLKDMKTAPLFMVILISWGIALLEYCFQVPANRIGINYFSVSQLKVIQEILAMLVFAGFSVSYLKIPVTRNYFIAMMFLAAAAYFIFKDNN